jgi:hypothetical protein
MERFINIYYTLIFQLITGLLPLMILYFQKKKFNIEFLVYLGSSVIATFIFFILFKQRVNNLLIFNGYQIFSITCLSIFYYNICNKSLTKKLILLIGSFCLFILFYELSQTSFIEYSLVYRTIGFILFSVIFFIDYLNSERQRNLQSFSYLIVNSSIFIYNSFSFLFFLYITILMVNDFWYFHNIIEGISKLIIAYAFWKLPKSDNFART